MSFGTKENRCSPLQILVILILYLSILFEKNFKLGRVSEINATKWLRSKPRFFDRSSGLQIFWLRIRMFMLPGYSKHLDTQVN